MPSDQIGWAGFSALSIIFTIAWAYMWKPSIIEFACFIAIVIVCNATIFIAYTFFWGAL